MTDKLLAQQDRQLRKQPWKIHSHQLFYKDVFESVRLSSGIEPSSAQAQDLLRRAASHFQTLSWQEKQFYKRRAEVYQQQKQEQHIAKLELLQAEIKMAQKEEDRQAFEHHFLCQLGNCKLDDKQLDMIWDRATLKNHAPAHPAVLDRHPRVSLPSS